MNHLEDPHPTACNAAMPDAPGDAERLAHRLAALLEQLRRALMARPWQAPALKELARLLESACRAAFADAAVWMSLSHGARLPGRALRSLRPGGARRADELIEQASQRLALLSAE